MLKPGGQLGILDFSEPGGLIGKAYAIYFRRVLPAIGRAYPRQPETSRAYNYLPRSVDNFPPPRGHAGDDAGRRIRRVRLAALHLRNRRVVHRRRGRL